MLLEQQLQQSQKQREPLVNCRAGMLNDFNKSLAAIIGYWQSDKDNVQTADQNNNR